ncbi:MAG: glycosyltransferase family 4 protein, partial [Pseudomonadota bacterium]
MRIVILYNSSWYVFLLRRNLIEALKRAGHELFVVAPRDAYTERVKQMGVSFSPITISGTSVSPLREAGSLVDIWRALKAIEPDLVLSFTAKCNLYAGLCRRVRSFGHVANVSGLGQLYDRQNLLRSGVDLLYKNALARTDLVFFQNREDRDILTEAGVVEMRRCAVLPGSGVDLKRFTPLWKPLSRSRSFLMFGRLLPKKGFGYFLEAAAEARRIYGERVAFWILGSADNERRESRQLLAEIKAAHAKGDVRYLHSTDDPLPFIREADAVVLPSTYNEGVPRSLLEALACGKPIITTDWKGCRETVIHGDNGLLVKPNDGRALFEAIERLINLDDDALREFGRASRALAEAKFDEGLVIGAYQRAITNLSTDT